MHSLPGQSQAGSLLSHNFEARNVRHDRADLVHDREVNVIKRNYDANKL